MLKLRSLLEDADPNELDPTRFPTKLSQVDADKAKLSTEVVLTENVVPLSNSPPPLKVTSLSEPIVLVVFPPPLPNFKVVLIPPETDISPATAEPKETSEPASAVSPIFL